MPRTNTPDYFARTIRNIQSEEKLGQDKHSSLLSTIKLGLKICKGQMLWLTLSCWYSQMLNQRINITWANALAYFTPLVLSNIKLAKITFQGQTLQLNLPEHQSKVVLAQKSCQGQTLQLTLHHRQSQRNEVF